MTFRMLSARSFCSAPPSAGTIRRRCRIPATRAAATGKGRSSSGGGLQVASADDFRPLAGRHGIACSLDTGRLMGDPFGLFVFRPLLVLVVEFQPSALAPVETDCDCQPSIMNRASPARTRSPTWTATVFTMPAIEVLMLMLLLAASTSPAPPI